MGKYDDIINLEHPTSKVHLRMSREARAAQFAPFAALTGYEDAVRETARLTDKRIDIDDELKKILNSKLEYIENNLDKRMNVTFTYFVPDLRKSGGSYIDIFGVVRRIDKVEGVIILTNKSKIPISEIISIKY
jgi:hypothetical protein